MRGAAASRRVAERRVAAGGDRDEPEQKPSTTEQRQQRRKRRRPRPSRGALVSTNGETCAARGTFASPERDGDRQRHARQLLRLLAGTTQPEVAVATARRLLDEGAAIVDVGLGESTRPGAEGVPRDEELRRVVPVLEELQGLPVSIDTAKAEVARRALEFGVELVNDVTALRGDPELAGSSGSRRSTLPTTRRRRSSCPTASW